MIDQILLPMDDPTRTGEARRRTVELCRMLGLGETESGEAAIIVAEMASNTVRHASEGLLIVRPLSDEEGGGLELLAIDRGGGMANIARCMEDGYSTAGSPGTGLGAIRRLSSEMDISSEPGGGTVLLARYRPASVRRGALLPPLEVGAVCVPVAGEEASGDAWSVQHLGERSLIFVADGLGHGHHAALASQEAVRLFRRSASDSPAEILQAIHEGLRSTRGAAVAVAEIDRKRRTLRFAGAGNIAGRIVTEGEARQTVSVNGTAGQEIRRIQEFSYPWNETSLLVMNSDGLKSRLPFPLPPRLASRDPSVIAAVLFRDHSRGSDDAVVAVARERRGERP